MRPGRERGRDPVTPSGPAPGIARVGSGLLAGLAAAATGLLAVVGTAAAQGVRGELVTTARYIEVRPLGLDTVPRDQVVEGPGGTSLFEGERVFCQTPEVCVRYRSRPAEDAVAVTQDLGLTGWGFGVEGLSARLSARARWNLGSEFVWPRTDDAFDLLEGYVQYNRGPLRGRLGRQRLTSGLGFSSYDGLSVLVEPDGQLRLRLEAYGGRSLARGLSEPRHDALRGAGTFLPEKDAWLVGGAIGAEPVPGTRFTARYQREIWSDRSALVSERAALDVRSDYLRPLRLEGSMDWDFAFGRVGKAHLTARLPVGDRVTVELTGRRYVPYFELWTIWGLFSPVAHHEAEARVSWTPSAAVGLWTGGGYRTYEGTDTDPVLGGVSDDGWTATVGGTVRPTSKLHLRGSYRMERSAGAFLSSGELRASWQALERLRLSVHGTASQQIEEFRVGEGVVVGGGASLRIRLPMDLELRGGASIYRQTFENRPGGVDWNQLRAWSSLRIPLGGDPGPEAQGRP